MARSANLGTAVLPPAPRSLAARSAGQSRTDAHYPDAISVQRQKLAGAAHTWYTMGRRRRSKALKVQGGQDPRAMLDVPYGPNERNKIDFFPGTKSRAPILVYLHGGYWQRGAREWYACMGEGVAAHGWSSPLVGYTIASTLRNQRSRRLAFDRSNGYGMRHRKRLPRLIWSKQESCPCKALQVRGALLLAQSPRYLSLHRHVGRPA
jgi:hypothetical protein